MKKNKKIMNKRGSALAYSLIIISIMAAITIGISAVSIVQKKSAGTTGSSTQSFQAADSGAQLAIKTITKSTKNLNELFGTCSGDTATVSNEAGLPANTTYELKFYDKNETQLTCASSASDVRKIKSIGRYKDTVRAVEVALSITCGETVYDASGNPYGSVVADDGKCWLDRNLGATKVATIVNDPSSNGWYFQWGRKADGHQNKNSAVVLAWSSADDVSAPNTAKFLRSDALHGYDWRYPQNGNLWQAAAGINNPCPAGFRVPTGNEFSDMLNAENITNSTLAFQSKLKMPVAGSRPYDSGTPIVGAGVAGLYWTSSVSGAKAEAIKLDASSKSNTQTERATGASVRCIKN